MGGNLPGRNFPRTVRNISNELLFLFEEKFFPKDSEQWGDIRIFSINKDPIETFFNGLVWGADYLRLKPYKDIALIPRWNDVDFHVVSTWNPRDVFVGKLLNDST